MCQQSIVTFARYSYDIRRSLARIARLCLDAAAEQRWTAAGESIPPCLLVPCSRVATKPLLETLLCIYIDAATEQRWAAPRESIRAHCHGDDISSV